MSTLYDPKDDSDPLDMSKDDPITGLSPEKLLRLRGPMLKPVTEWVTEKPYATILNNHFYYVNHGIPNVKIRRLRLFGLACLKSVPEIHPKPKDPNTRPWISQSSAPLPSTTSIPYYLFQKAVSIIDRVAEEGSILEVLTELRSFLEEFDRLWQQANNRISGSNLYQLIYELTNLHTNGSIPRCVANLINRIVQMVRDHYTKDQGFDEGLSRPPSEVKRNTSIIQGYVNQVISNHAQILVNFVAPGWEFKPEWRTEDAISLSKQMYQNQDFSSMPILADMLQDAGCDQIYLTRMRNKPQNFYRGNYITDWLLGHVPSTPEPVETTYCKHELEYLSMTCIYCKKTFEEIRDKRLQCDHTYDTTTSICNKCGKKKPEPKQCDHQPERRGEWWYCSLCNELVPQPLENEEDTEDSDLEWDSNIE